IKKRELLQSRSYQKVYSAPVRIFMYTKPFLDYTLPAGFSVITLEDENDCKKINDCLWKGFDHGDQPDDDLDSRLLMQSGPHFRKDLTTIIKAPNGEYACYTGMWFNKKNNYAYLESLATDPKYRRVGLATIALTQGMKKTKELGALFCFGGEPDFYTGIGFETICYRELWKKEW
ncbi:MAG: GNAT family N-acetyltransferase, partial [Firmicutes bacterium]|nr:GNAT family N-acetyltransferase [Bacillota bacterium]